MKASNVALRLAPPEDQPGSPLERQQVRRAGPPETAHRPPRPRRSLTFRTIVISDQGLRPFRCG